MTGKQDARDLDRMIRAFQVAMTDEKIPAGVIERVVNRVVYGDPRGYRRRAQAEPVKADLHIHIHPGSNPNALVDAVRRQAASRLYPPQAIRVR